VSTPSASTAAASPASSDPRRFRALGVIALAQLMVVLDASIVTVALPSAQADLGISTADRQWVFTAYTLAFGGLLLLGGRVADYVGRKRAFEIGLLGFAAASAFGGLAQNQAMLFGARGAQGVFAALLAPAALSLLTTTFTDPKERTKAFGIYGAVSGGAMSLGLIAGGMLTEWASWEWTLLVNVPIALVALIGSRRFIRGSKAEGEPRYDLVGAVLATVGLVALVYGFTNAGENGWGSGMTVVLLVAAVVLLAAFVAVEARTAHPLLPLRVLADRTRGGAFLAMLLTIAGLFSTFVLLTYYLQDTLGYSALETGLAYLPYSVGTFVGATLASKLIPRFGVRPIMVTGIVLGAIGTLLFTRIGVDTGFASHLLPAEVVSAVGLGLALVSLTSTALLGIAPHDAGVGSALLNTTQQIGTSLGTALLNTIAATATAGFAAERAAAVVHGYTTAFTVGAVFLALSALIALIMVRGRRVDGAPDPTEAADTAKARHTAPATTTV